MNDSLRLWPAIDLRGGRIVRLLHGSADAETRYDGAPADAARRFEAEGADGLHVVDLDGAFGTGDNRATLLDVVSAVRIPVAVGGGLRTRADLERILGEGAARAVVGSLVFSQPELFEELARENPGRIVAAFDCREGVPQVKGWTESSGAQDVAELAGRLSAVPLAALLVTDIARDGAMTGPNIELLARVRSRTAHEILASGGVRGPEDLAPIDAALAGGRRGVILGRALHGGHTTVAALSAAIASAEVSR